MCGIAGIIVKSNIDPTHERAVHGMLHAMTHRGPDGKGVYRDRSLVMGMRRLSIIDLQGGWQPLYNEDKSLVLIANGEIYNYVELTSVLQARGHRFSSRSDSETILHLYEDHGEECVHHLRGMFAFALFDKKNGSIMLARDRMGEKPLYIHESEGFLIFASEMKSLLSSGCVPFNLDPASVNDFFHYQYVPEPRTPLKGVRKLPAGTCLTVDVASWRLQEKVYWRMEDAPPVEGDPISLIRDELDSVSKLIIRSDVPVGIALSGGLDSSAIAALAVKKYPGTMHAFSVGYPGRPANDERNDAKALANWLQMPIHEIELTKQTLVDVFENMNFWRDDPIADISGFGYYAISKEAKNHGVPVLLQGQGGDELFWGYSWVKDAVIKTEAMQGRSFIGKMLEHSKRLPALRFNSVRSYLDWTKSLTDTIYETITRVIHASNKFRPIFHELHPDFQLALSSMNNIYDNAFKKSLDGDSAFDVYTYSKPWEFTDIRLTRLICETYLLENGIAQGDRLSMANSVELRLPFVDYKLVELVIGLRKTRQNDPDYKQFPKPWLRGAMKNLLPDWVIDRPKQGFAPPVREWHDALFNKYGHYLIDGYLVQSRTITAEAGKILASGPYPPEAFTPISFKALVLEMWCRSMIKQI